MPFPLQFVERPLSDRVAAALKEAAEISHFVLDRTNVAIDFGPPADDGGSDETKVRIAHKIKVRTALQLFTIAADHYAAMNSLVQLSMPSSAFALIRSIFDACWRGAWIAWVATDVEVMSFVTGTTKVLQAKTQIERLSQVPEIGTLFERIRLSRYDELCDYNHSGALQISSWSNGDVVAPCHSEDAIVDLMEHAGWLVLIAAIGFTSVLDLDDEELLNRMRTYQVDHPAALC